MSKHTLRLYEFGPFRLNVTERLLQCSDTEVALTPKVIDTLVVLVENSGHVLGKDELMHELWPDSFVEESSLTQNISLLRKALSENSNGQQYIETIPKRGYRFVARVRAIVPSETELLIQERTSTQIVIEEEQSDSGAHTAIAEPSSRYNSSSAYRKKLRYGLAAFLLLTLSISAVYYFAVRNRASSALLNAKSIAVLPFKTVGAGNETDVLGLGMADAIILRLSRDCQKTVLPTSSIFKYTGNDSDALSAGRALGVDAVLAGTLQRDGDRVRVTAQLITLEDGKTVWSGKFEQDYGSVFTLQDSIADKLSTALQPEIGSQKQPPLAKHDTENREAYQAYLSGLYFWSRRTKPNLSKAIDYFQEAVNKDPNFALAFAHLADCYYLSYQLPYLMFRMDDALNRADAAATRALQLDDLVPEAHLVKAGVLADRMDYQQADQEFQRALQLNPNHATAHLRYGYFLFGSSRLEECVEHMKLAQELDPVSPITNTALGYAFTMSRNPDEAIRSFAKALELQPETVVARFDIAQIYADKRMFDLALAEFEKLQSTDPVLTTQGKAYVYALTGRRAEALAAIRQLETPKEGPSMTYYDLAVLYAAVGEKEMAYQYLRKIVPRRFNIAKLRFDPQLDSLRSEARFAELLSHLDSVRAQDESQCSPGHGPGS
jgi:DNA-binding winged helix-turn-helix (wHTH) protein/TolB-like protein/Flp pilus assembly protein TadD